MWAATQRSLPSRTALFANNSSSLTMATKTKVNADHLSLKSIVIPASVEEIDAYAIFDSSITAIRFEVDSKLKKIGATAFADCSMLKSIVIPASVEKMGESVFYDAHLNLFTLKKILNWEK